MNHSLSVSQTQTTVMCEMTLTGELNLIDRTDVKVNKGENVGNQSSFITCRLLQLMIHIITVSEIFQYDSCSYPC